MTWIVKMLDPMRLRYITLSNLYEHMECQVNWNPIQKMFSKLTKKYLLHDLPNYGAGLTAVLKVNHTLPCLNTLLHISLTTGTHVKSEGHKKLNDYTVSYKKDVVITDIIDNI